MVLDRTDLCVADNAVGTRNPIPETIAAHESMSIGGYLQGLCAIAQMRIFEQSKRSAKVRFLHRKPTETAWHTRSPGEPIAAGPWVRPFDHRKSDGRTIRGQYHEGQECHLVQACRRTVDCRRFGPLLPVDRDNPPAASSLITIAQTTTGGDERWPRRNFAGKTRCCSTRS
jgi:hypothetical protein